MFFKKTYFEVRILSHRYLRDIATMRVDGPAVPYDTILQEYPGTGYGSRGADRIDTPSSAALLADTATVCCCPAASLVPVQRQAGGVGSARPRGRRRAETPRAHAWSADARSGGTDSVSVQRVRSGRTQEPWLKISMSYSADTVCSA
eukprot:SAG31_NODE_1806_length_7230_cov_40.014164_5_plen_147_part_00